MIQLSELDDAAKRISRAKCVVSSKVEGIEKSARIMNGQPHYPIELSKAYETFVSRF